MNIFFIIMSALLSGSVSLSFLGLHGVEAGTFHVPGLFC